ncbi:tyrosine-type recombinase/integrase [Nocardia cyriacigeorgica]|uniref:Tyrosine-type recombinase/integrase n=1 Tax=Nocardia cyriacigeorgica TaxID=135487 RepID=A0ABX0CQ08_9NOCA|nr:tyrosine-type recombinase/integrase [Nocardia cyriacigeorgica]NEW58583.1 tyrosine-type recombinase/integrase [Nocardia cyriacigeorgica]
MASPVPDLAELLPSWELSLRAERRSKETLDAYRTGVRQFLAYCDRIGTPPVLSKATVSAFVADLLDRGAEPTTARLRQTALKRYSAWLAAEGESDHDDLLGLKPPKLDTKIVSPLNEDELRALFRACQGRDPRDLRDEAILRLMAETGLRASEAAGLSVVDVDLAAGLVTARRGKGGRGRRAPFGPQTGRAVDRYLRSRRRHPMADKTPALWMGAYADSTGLTYNGLYAALKYRAKLAGVENFHPHRLRHTAATRWLSAGGSEGGLMAVAGWSNRAMLDRYTAATKAERAAAEARKLNLGDL